MKINSRSEPIWAPEYTKAEKAKFIGLSLIFGVLLIVANKLWFTPELQAFSATAHCQTFWGINGITWLWYGLFVALPLHLFILVAAYAIPTARRILTDGQFPAKGKKVFKPTRIIFGNTAKLIGWLHLFSPILLLLLICWGAQQAHTLSQQPVATKHIAQCKFKADRINTDSDA
ncbi:hypothetical protein K6Y31_01175 [Motilimonas cestriensis]|uniref:Transmembrane protein n=1 Tax=Motilimonas cestriensis TaxID=2742685 RepID=A0ABS8W4X7_9GAMM|nr:hypothetical protein [Motilimonas cestriensis]MCE2593432.1 hypothetical protein [Motilimonas cestriensis]